MGEIVVRGNVVMAGYYCDPEATARAIRDGWFYSGDAAVVHPDGYLEIRDRLKDVIISGGENIAPLEVEAALVQCPGVLEVCAFGVADARWGQVVAAGVRASDEHAPSQLVAELAREARRRLATYKRPRFYVCAAELTYGKNGKLDRRATIEALRARLEAEPERYRAPSE